MLPFGVATEYLFKLIRNILHAGLVDGTLNNLITGA